MYNYQHEVIRQPEFNMIKTNNNYYKYSEINYIMYGSEAKDKSEVHFTLLFRQFLLILKSL